MKASPNAGRSGPGNAARRNAALRAASSRPRAPSASSASPPSSRRGRAPDVEEVEPLGRALAHDPLEGGHPGASRLFLTASGYGQRLGHRHGVPVALIEQAERGDEGHPHGAGEDEWPERERRGRSRRRGGGRRRACRAPGRPARRPPPRAGAPPPARGRRSGATAARSARPRRHAEPSARDRGPRPPPRPRGWSGRRGAARRRPASSQLPTCAVSEMKPPWRCATRSAPSTRATWEWRLRRGLTIRGHEIAEAHREVREGPDGERVEPGAGGAGHARERAPDDALLSGHEPRHHPSDATRQGEPRASRQPPEGRREPVEIGAVVGVLVPARSRDRVLGRE